MSRILYRRTRAEMPAIAPEIEGALEEGVTIEFLAAPTGDSPEQRNGRRLEMHPHGTWRSRCLRPSPAGAQSRVRSSSSRPRLIIAAISQEPEFGPVSTNCGRARTGSRPTSGEPQRAEGVYAGGDDLTLALVAIAISQGRMAAEAIDAHLRGENLAKARWHLRPAK